MMSEDIHKWTDGRYALMFDEHTFFVFDNEKEKEMTALQTTKKLNEQQAMIDKLTSQLQGLCDDFERVVNENSVLRKENEQLKIANAKWLDKSLQDKQIRYDNSDHDELVRRYLQLKEEIKNE